MRCPQCDSMLPLYGSQVCRQCEQIAYSEGMHALASLMYWAQAEAFAQYIAVEDVRFRSAIHKDTDWVQQCRDESFASSFRCEGNPPGLEWVR